jgi:anti-anti-sigma factor
MLFSVGRPGLEPCGRRGPGATRRPGGILLAMRDFSMKLLPAQLDGVERVQLAGELDIASASVVEDVLLDLFSPVVELDLSRLTFVDARATGMLLRVRRAMSESSRNLVVYGAQGAVRRVFSTLDLDELLSQSP